MNNNQNRFPDDISIGAVGGPEFATTIITMQNGKEQRNINWQNARCKYNISYGIKTKKQAEKVIELFRLKRGKALPFRFKDYSDFQAINQLIAISDGGTNTFQLVKSYGIYEESEVRIICKPVLGSVEIFLNDEITHDYQIDYETGIISFIKSPEIDTKITANFEFDVWVRFDNDKLNITVHSCDFLSMDDINLIEVKV